MEYLDCIKELNSEIDNSFEKWKFILHPNFLLLFWYLNVNKYYNYKFYLPWKYELIKNIFLNKILENWKSKGKSLILFWDQIHLPIWFNIEKFETTIDLLYKDKVIIDSVNIDIERKLNINKLDDIKIALLRESIVKDLPIISKKWNWINFINDYKIIIPENINFSYKLLNHIERKLNKKEEFINNLFWDISEQVKNNKSIEAMRKSSFWKWSIQKVKIISDKIEGYPKIKKLGKNLIDLLKDFIPWLWISSSLLSIIKDPKI